MHIYPADLRLHEHTFFASREIGTLYESEPLVGNYALTYALGLCQSPYRLEAKASGPRYRLDFAPLNEAGLYLTPAGFSRLNLALTQFNGQVDSYYFRFEQNAIAASRATVRAMNFPQSGRIRMLGLGSQARFYLLDRDHLIEKGKGPRLLPYIRLGKFMSKARLEWGEKIVPDLVKRDRLDVACLLNAADLPDPSALLAFSSYNIHPAPVLRDVVMRGEFWQVAKANFLPVGMQYGVSQG
jgi:CRISPR-associated protein Csc1